MKRMFYTLLIVSFSTFYTIHPMQHTLPYLSSMHHVITNFSFQLPSHYFAYCHNYLKNIDVVKVLMVGAVGILLLDKIYPIFPVKTKVVLPYETFNQTEIMNHIKSGVTAGIKEFKKKKYKPNKRVLNQKIIFGELEVKQKEESFTTINNPESETREKEAPIKHTVSDKQPDINPELQPHFEKVAAILGQKTQNPLQGSFDIYEINHDEITRVETIKKEFLKIEKKLLKKINRKFLKIKKKSPLFSSLPVIPEASSTSDNDNDENIKSEEADDIFGPLNNNVFKDSALVDSALLMTQEGICKQKNAQQITPCILRSNGDDLDILLEENN